MRLVFPSVATLRSRRQAGQPCRRLARHRLLPLLLALALAAWAPLQAAAARLAPDPENSSKSTSSDSSGSMSAQQAAAAAVRPIKAVIRGQKMMEGAGVRICRTLGTPALKNLDPFLMLDELKMPADQASAGFPDHPHRGFETCSIMLSGKMEHADSMGNKGVIGPGGVQWMTAGRGVVHSEMPVVTSGQLHGFQLWINLPAKDKMCKPRYQDYQADDIPAAESDGASVRVMAGSRGGVAGPIKLRNPGMLLDVRLQPGASFTQHVPEAWNGFAYVYEGKGRIGDKNAQEEHAYILHNEGDTVAATAGEAGLKFLLICGKPIGEPIVQYGPFVMNHELEIRQAFLDYQSGKLQRPEDNPWVSESDSERGEL